LKVELSKSRTPERIGASEIKKKKINKILSGNNHTLALVEGKVFVWGDAENGILGRLPSSRRKVEQGLKVETITVKGPVEDIYTGANHAFIKKSETKKKETHNVILGWGLNNFGQLGTGSLEKTHYNPTEIEVFTDKNIKSITGGKRHTLVLTAEGEVLAFGINDLGQLGLGRNFREVMENTEEKTEELEKPESLIGFTWARNPQKMELANVEKIFSRENLNYAITKDNQVYSWGAGESFVLGTGHTENLWVSTRLENPLFDGQRIRQIGLGFEHAVILTGEADPQLEEELLNQEFGKSGKKGTQNPTIGKKGKGKKDEGEAEKDLEEEATKKETPAVKKSLKKKASEDGDDEVAVKKIKKSLSPTQAIQQEVAAEEPKKMEVEEKKKVEPIAMVEEQPAASEEPAQVQPETKEAF